MYFVPGKGGAPSMIRAEHDPVKPDCPPPPAKLSCVAKRVPKPSRVARRVPKRRRVTRRVPKRRCVARRAGKAKYKHPADKWIELREKLREARVRNEGLVRTKMADFMRKALPTYTAATAAEHPSKYKDDVVEQVSDTPVEVNVAVTPKREGRDYDDDAENIDLRKLVTTPRFRDKLYGIRKEGHTLTIGNSVVDLDTPGVMTVKGRQFKLTWGLWELLTRNDVDTGTISPNDMQIYKSILKLTSAHLSGYEPDGNIKISRGVKYVKVISTLFPTGTIKHRWDKY
jgi:hypothetical protein